MSKLLKLMGLFLGVIALAVPLYGDTIHLKNGNKIQGQILSDSGKWVRVRVAGGVTYVKKSKIAKIEKGDSRGNSLRGGTSSTSRSQAQISLSLKRGESVNYHFQSKMDRSINIPKMKRKLVEKEVLDVKYTLKCLETKGEKHLFALIPTRYRVTYTVTDPKGTETTRYDSQTPPSVDKLKKKKNLLVYHRKAMVAALFSVNSRGKVDQIKYTLRNNFSKEMGRKWAAHTKVISQVVHEIPTGMIQVGDQWTSSLSSFIDEMHSSAKASMAVNKFEKIGEREVIRVDGSLDGEIDYSRMQTLNFLHKKKHSTNRDFWQIKVWMDLKKGYVTNYTLVRRCDVEINGLYVMRDQKGRPGPKVPITVNYKRKDSSTLEEK